MLLIPNVDVQPIAIAVGNWYFDRAVVKAIDCAYPCDHTCHNLIFKWQDDSLELTHSQDSSREVTYAYLVGIGICSS